MAKISGTGFASIFSVLFKLKGAIPLTLVIILLMSIGAISESVEQKSPAPFFKSFGGFILNHDQILYQNAIDLQSQGGVYLADESFSSKMSGLWTGLKYFGTILYGWWIFYVLLLLFVKMAQFFITNNVSAVFGNVMLAIIFIAMLQVVGGLIVIAPDLEDYQSLDTLKKLVPFRGMYESIKTVPLVFKPVYSNIDDYSININTTGDFIYEKAGEIINETNYTKNI